MNASRDYKNANWKLSYIFCTFVEFKCQLNGGLWTLNDWLSKDQICYIAL